MEKFPALNADCFDQRIAERLDSPEADTLCRYCQELTQLTSEQQRVIEDLLFELVSYFSDRLKAPRWLRTEQGDIVL